MKAHLNQVEQEMLHILYNNGNPVERSLQRVLRQTDQSGRERLHNFKGSEILFGRKQLEQMGLIEIEDTHRRHDLEEGDGITRLNDDVTFYFSELDKKLRITDKGQHWCRKHKPLQS